LTARGVPVIHESNVDATVRARHHAGVRALAGVAAILTICVIGALTPLAYADPPDPSWVDGLWDDNDYDNVVVLVLATCAVVAESLIDAAPRWSAIAVLPPSDVRTTPAPVDETASPRAPPLPA
jgi:hypothetical protein